MNYCVECERPIPPTTSRRKPKYCGKRCYRRANARACRERNRALHIPKTNIRRPRRPYPPQDSPADQDRERQALARFEARQAAEASNTPKPYRAPTLAAAEAIAGVLAPPRDELLTGNARQASYGAGQPRIGEW